MVVDNIIPEMIAKEIKERKLAAWERLDKTRGEIKNWSDLADDLDDILEDLIIYFQPESSGNGTQTISESSSSRSQ